MDPRFPRANQLAIKNGKIIAVSNTQNLLSLKNKYTKIIDCRGKTVLPGFIDPHIHLFALAESFLIPNLQIRDKVYSISDIQKILKKISQQLPPGMWIRAKGYNEFYLIEKRHPNRFDLDAVSTQHPIKITHQSGQAIVLNTLGLKIVGISKETPDPPGGLIDRSLENGEPTGLLFGMEEHISKAIPPIDLEKLELGIRLANQKLYSCGITSIGEASPQNDFDRWKLLMKWTQNGFLNIRTKMYLGKNGFQEYQRNLFSSPTKNSYIPIGGIKIMITETTGDLSPDQSELNEITFKIHRSKLQAVFHAIEEKSIEAACKAVNYALKKYPRYDHRHRIEHCSICPPSLMKKISALGISVVTQPSFIFYNGDRYLKTVPQTKISYLYPIGSLIKNKVEVAGSSDCPIAPVNPIIGIYSAMSRKIYNNESLLPEERISIKDALEMYTIKGAKVLREENIKGSIAINKLADLVILNADIDKLSMDEIKDVKVEITILNGKIIYNSAN